MTTRFGLQEQASRQTFFATEQEAGWLPCGWQPLCTGGPLSVLHLRTCWLAALGAWRAALQLLEV